MDNLFTIRIKSFLYSAGSVALIAFLGALLSPEFQTLISEYTGTALWGTILSLVVTEIIKALRNYSISKSAPAGAVSPSGKMYF